MKKKSCAQRYLLLLLFQLPFLIGVQAGAQKLVTTSGSIRAGSLTIAGSVDTNKSKDSVLFQVYRHYFKANYTTNGELYASKINGHIFEWKLDAITGPVYIGIRLNKSLDTRSIFLAEPGDSIFIKVEGDSMSFSGRGAERFACQAKIFAPDDVKARHTEGMYDFLQDLKHQTDSLYESRLAVLESYRTKISAGSYDLLKADLEGAKNIKIMADARFYYKFRRDEKDRSGVRAFYDAYTREMTGLPDVVGGHYLASKTYTDFLFDRVYSTLYFTYGNSMDELFPRLYDHIDKNYQGLLRDKLIATCFLEMFQKCPEASLYLERGANSIQDVYYRSILQKLITTKAPGALVYNFSLENEAGKQVTLKDFRNKIVIADFWFSGCFGCAQLNKVMGPVIDSFKNRKDVVFVSINVDERREQWKKSIAKGEYTHPESVNLFTNGLGSRHPIVNHYGYKGFPQVLLINKAGKLISANPPLPFGADSARRFIALINSAAD